MLPSRITRAAVPLAQSHLYGWNPVLLKKTYNSAHMDVIALPFVLTAVWLVLCGRPVRAGLAKVSR